MDPLRNPYSPGAGAPPPALTGRDEIRDRVRTAVARIRAGRGAKSVLLVGLRGVGKTVLLEQMRVDAEAANCHTVWIEAPEQRSLPAMLAPQLRTALIRLSKNERAKDLARRALQALAGFVGALKVRFDDIEVGIDVEPEQGLADAGDLDNDLQELLGAIGEAAKAAETAFVLFIDELQYVEESQLAALITALHRCAQRRQPVVLVGAGLPQLRGQMGRAKSYAERLFDYPSIGPLPDEAARAALADPAQDEGVTFAEPALARIVEHTQGYPYFLQ